MATTAQVIANQSNAKKSTGPTTEAGKAKSSKNRLSYGFASSTRFILVEKPEDFYALLTDLTSEYHPATPTEEILVEDMTHHRWISLRARRIQGDLMGGMMQLRDNSLSIPGVVTRDLPLYIRYQNTADRAFHKAHEALVKAQKQREKSAIGFESQNAPMEHNAEDEAPIEAPPQAPKAAPKPAPQPAAKPAPNVDDLLTLFGADDLADLGPCDVEALLSLMR